MSRTQQWRALSIMLIGLLTMGAIGAAPASAAGSDGPTPYSVTASGVTMPAGVTFESSGHVNYKATKLDGTGEKSFGVHFDPNNKQPGGRFIGQSFFGFTDYPATAQYGAITSSAASAFPDGYCITWVQVSKYNEHFGEGGQKPVCTTPPGGGGNVDCPTGTTELAKYEWKGSSYVAEHGGQVVTVSGTTQSGTFTVVGNYTVSAVVVKGSTDSKVVTFNPAVKSGSFDGSGLQTPSGQTPAISNVKFCGSTTPAETEVTPTAPTYNDVCETKNDTYTIPSKAGVKYLVNGTEKAAGTYSGTGTVTITAQALPGYKIKGTDSWTFTFTNVACPVTETEVTPTAPTYNDVCETKNDTYTIPSKAGVKYLVNGTEKAAGTYSGTGTVTITAQALPGYKIKGTDSWTFTFTNVACPVTETEVTPTAPTYNDVCETKNDTYTIPSKAGVKYLVNGTEKAAGTYSGTGTVTITAQALPGYKIKGTDSWTFTFTNVACPVTETEVTPTAPTYNDVCETKNDTYTIPSKAGVKYLVNGTEKAAGTYSGTGTVTITAQALPGYKIKGTDSWTFTFTNVACPVTETEVTPTAPTYNDVCETKNDTYTIPSKAGVKYLVNGTEKAAGTYSGTGTVTITAQALPGYKIKGTDSWTFTFTNVACPVTETEVTPTAPTYNDVCETKNDTYTIPSKAGVKYLVNGTEKAAGTYSGTGTVTITAQALPGYKIKGTDSWTFTFTNVACPVTETFVPSAPSAADKCEPLRGSTKDRLFIPVDANFQYSWNGRVLTPGALVANRRHYEIKATPLAGVVQTPGSTDVWKFDFTKKDCFKPKVVKASVKQIDKCGRASDLYGVKASKGVVYKVNGKVIREGVWLKATGKRVVVKAFAASDRFELVGKTKWVLRYNTAPCDDNPPNNPPNTGA